VVRKQFCVGVPVSMVGWLTCCFTTHLVIHSHDGYHIVLGPPHFENASHPQTSLLVKHEVNVIMNLKTYVDHKV